jgi:hypothetical protein
LIPNYYLKDHMFAMRKSFRNRALIAEAISVGWVRRALEIFPSSTILSRADNFAWSEFGRAKRDAKREPHGWGEQTHHGAAIDAGSSGGLRRAGKLP